MNELKKGDFSGIYTRETGKPLFYTGIFDRMTDEDGRPCVFLATDPSNKNTFYRWTQSDLLKRGYYISKTGKNTIPRTAARLHIIFTHSGSLDGVRAVVEKDIYNRWIATTETGEQYMLFSDHIRIAAYCIILKTETAEEIENSGMHPYQIMYIRKSLEAVQAEPLPEESTNAQEGPTADESNTDKETTTGADKATEEATQRPQEATTSAGTNTDTETPTEATKASQEASQDPQKIVSDNAGEAANTMQSREEYHRAPQRPHKARNGPQADNVPPEPIQGHHRPRKRTRNPDMLPAIIPDKLPTISPDPEPLPAIIQDPRRATHPEPLPKLSRAALLPNHPRPATLARMPQDARNEHRPIKYTPSTPKARHGPHRKPAGIPAAAARTGEK